MPDIDWSNPACKISDHFTVKDVCYLPSWEIMHIPSDEEKANALALVQKLELIRSEIDKPIYIHCWIRPKVVNCPSSSRYHGKNYNAAVGGAPGSAHIEGKAADFHAASWTCDDLREFLLPYLNQYQIRMENKPESGWVHVDIREPLPRQSRFFRP